MNTIKRVKKLMQMIALRLFYNFSLYKRQKLSQSQYVSIICALFMIGGSILHAEVHIEAEEKVTVVFTYNNPTASKVTIAGNFQGWNPNTHPMTRNDEGVWMYTIEASMSDVFIYKFLPDGQWTCDTEAPDFLDDGFGGLNGYVVVSEVLAIQKGADEDAAAATGALHFSTAMSVRGENRFLTRDLATGEIRGYEFNSSELVTSSYWGITGDILPGLALNLQIKALSGSTSLFEANTLGTEAPFTSAYSGAESFMSNLFSPITSLNEGIVSIDKMTLDYTGDFLGVRTAHGIANNTSSSLIFEIVKARHANDGFLELTNGNRLQTFGDFNLDIMSGLTNQKLDGYGLYSWLTLGWTETFNATINYNIHSPEKELFNFTDNYDHALALGFDTLLADILTSQLHYLVCIGPDKTIDLDKMAIAARTELELGAYTGEMIMKLAGDDVYTVFGDDDDLGIGLFSLEMNQFMQPNSFFNAGIDSNFAMDNFDSISDEDMNIGVEPYVYLFLKEIIPLDIATRLYGKLSVDIIGEATDADRPVAFKLNEAGLQATWIDISPKVLSLTVDYGLSLEHGDFDLVDDTFPLDWLYNTVSMQAVLDNELSANIAAVIRSRGNSDDATDADVPLGFGIGISWITPWEKIMSPTMDINFTWNAEPYVDGASSLYFNEDNNFRLNNLSENKGESFLRFGLTWSF